MEKVKLAELVVDSNGSIIRESLGEIVPRFAVEGFDAAADLGLTPTQLARLEKRVLEKMTQNTHAAVEEALLAGKGVEFPHTLLIVPSKSTKRKNKNGSPLCRLSTRVRKDFKELLNKE